MTHRQSAVPARRFAVRRSKRVDIEFEADDRPGQYFTDTPFGGSVQVFAQSEVRKAKIYSKIKKG